MAGLVDFPEDDLPALNELVEDVVGLIDEFPLDREHSHVGELKYNFIYRSKKNVFRLKFTLHPVDQQTIS